ncbi:hypothetical protein PBAL39_15639 [Pedobacter sp. BAL39]|uniref:hypothetical protein n=1 Tax=Pedobacter sp. BAL39 TaxID=391596 RepID=UPI0001559EDD|nr:hypothetical protein [Pedobacter sp. BAL39]EDM37871.1 hypothetical protein PBAL39_15639 [Pedobacter sp. BAL39]
MEVERKISADDYGFFLLSPTVLELFLKSKSIKSKKILAHFNKRKEDLNEAIQEGILIPVNQIPAYTYSIFVSTEVALDSLNDRWELVLQEGEFNLKIDNSNSLWFISLVQFHNWNPGNFCTTADYTGYLTESGAEGKEEFEYTGQKYRLDAGNYLVAVTGLKRKVLEYEDEQNYGYFIGLIALSYFL